MPEDSIDPLLQAVRDLLDALDPSDREVIVGKLDSHARLEQDMAECARKVLALADQADEPIPPGEYRRLAAATLTPSHKGVAQNPGHAFDKYRRYLRRGALAPEMLVAVGRVSEALIPLLVATVRIRDRVLAARGPAVPAFVVTAVSAACAHGLGLDRDRASDEEVTDAVMGVLRRGTVLARDYELSGRPRAGRCLPGSAETASVGNSSFLEQIAAWHVAIAERVGHTEHARPVEPDDPLNALEKVLPDIEQRLHHAATRAPHRSWTGPGEEPDVVLVFGELAAFLGAAAGDGAAVTRKVVDRLTPALRRLRLRRDPRTNPVDFSDQDPATLGYGGQHAASSEARLTQVEDNLAYIQRLVAWTVATFFEGVAVADREILLTWLTGDRPVDMQDDLLFLVCCLRVALHGLRRIPDHPPTEMALAKPDYLHLVTCLLPALTRAVTDHGPDCPARAVAAALPALWTRRRPAVQVVAAHVQEKRADATYMGRAKAALVAATGVYGPAQHIDRSRGDLPRRCCWDRPDGATCAHPDTEPPRSVTAGRTQPATDPCRERPWSEIGVVENYTTLAEWARFGSPEAARKQLERYWRDKQPGHEMLIGS